MRLAQIVERMNRAADRELSPKLRWAAVADLLYHAPWDLRALIEQCAKLEARVKEMHESLATHQNEIERLHAELAERQTWIATLEARDPAVAAIKSYVGVKPQARPQTRPASRVAPPPVPPADSTLELADSISLVDSVILKLDSDF